MISYRNEGQIVELQIPGGGVVKDVPVQIGQLIVIPTVTADYAANTRFSGLVRGVVFGLPKKASQAWTEGQPVYWDAELEELTSVAGDNHQFGFALAAVAGGVGDTEAGEVLFNGAMAIGDETT